METLSLYGWARERYPRAHRSPQSIGDSRIDLTAVRDMTSARLSSDIIMIPMSYSSLPCNDANCASPFCPSPYAAPGASALPDPASTTGATTCSVADTLTKSNSTTKSGTPSSTFSKPSALSPALSGMHPMLPLNHLTYSLPIPN